MKKLKMKFPVTCKTGEAVASYSEYLKTEHWKDVRKRYWESKYKKQCQVCKRSQVPLDLHHKTYKRLGNEYLWDFILLCRTCHTGTHEVYKRQVSQNDNLWKAHKPLRKKFNKKGSSAYFKIMKQGKYGGGSQPKQSSKTT